MEPSREETVPGIWEAVVRDSPDALVCAGRDGRILAWNRAAERLFGYRADEALGESLDLMIPERFREAHWKGFDEAVRSGRTRAAEGRVMTTRSMHKDGSRLYVDVAFGLVRDDDGAVVAVVASARRAEGPAR